MKSQFPDMLHLKSKKSYKFIQMQCTLSYYPISVLPVFSKFLERIVYNRLINFLNKYDIISRNQYGFRKIILLHML